MTFCRRTACAILLALLFLLPVPAGASAAFGFETLTVSAKNRNGTSTTQAGAHPFSFTVNAALKTAGGSSDGDVRSLSLHLPPGLLINPTTVSECSAVAFHTPRTSPFESSVSGESCPSSSQVGVAKVDVGGVTRYFGLFNLGPPVGSAAAVGLSPFGVPLVLTAQLRESDYGFDLDLAEVPQSFDLQSLELTIWGAPWVPASSTPGPHNDQRGNCLDEQTGGSWGECLVFESAAAPENLIKSYLTMPTTPCSAPLHYSLGAVSWQGQAASAEATSPALVSCNKALTIANVQLMTDAAASRTGLVFNLSVNDGGGITNPAGIARPAVKKAIVSLPEGLTLNPSLGAGLGVCTEADFARETISSAEGAGCPNDSKIGDVTVEGEIALSEPMQGSLYVAAPHANPFDSLLAVYMVARLPRRGLFVKSIGKIEPAEGSGRLTATFDELPRVLYTHFTLTLREGQRSALISPPTCGDYPAEIAMSSWAEPEAFAREMNAFSINRGEGGAPCPSGGLAPFEPALIAGSTNPRPHSYTPFYLRMSRNDGEQEITSYSATFPPGLLAKIAGVAECPDAAIEAAKGMTGTEELESPSCPENSRIGRTMAGYGLGGTLAWAPGGLYLAGPYHGAPLSVVAIDSALVGPFDLGTVVVRQAVQIDPRTARVSLDATGSDPIPHILLGIPIHLRDIRVYVDRPNFMVTPTSCDPMHVVSKLTGAGADLFNPADDVQAESSQRYQLLGCSALGFKPKLTLRLSAAKHAAYPSLRARYVPRPGDANVGAVSVRLPASIFLAQEHIAGVCTRVEFARSACPADSIYGSARALTPLLGEPLEGPVYLRSDPANAVPDLVADLRGHGIEIEVPSRIDSTHGGIRAKFENLPDAPVTSFTLNLKGGRRGLLQNGEAACMGVHRVNARFVAQDNATSTSNRRLLARCGKSKRKPKKRPKVGRP